MCEEIRIYVACLASYNNGILYGAWIDAAQELEDIQDSVSEMLSKSPVENSEEYAIHDYEGFCGYYINEYEGLASVCEIASFIEDQQSLGAELLSMFGGNVEEAKQAIDEHYVGHFKSLADYAQELTEETAQIPEHLKFYIDYEKMARDMEMNGDVYTITTGFHDVYVFWSH
ncbi:MAG: antirestriction protein ArdA [Cellvibrionaceae bacterium]